MFTHHSFKYSHFFLLRHNKKDILVLFVDNCRWFGCVRRGIMCVADALKQGKVILKRNVFLKAFVL